MSININGNKVAKFGKNLPTAYMDEIQVMATEVTVMSSCYFLKPENTTEDSFMDYVEDTLSNLYLVNILIPDSVVPHVGIDGDTSDYSSTEPGVENFNNVFNYDGNGNGLDIENALKHDSSNIFEIIRHCNMSKVKNSSTSGIHYFRHIDGTKEIYIPKTETDFDALFYVRMDHALEGYDVMYDNFGNEIIRCRLKQTFSIKNDDYRPYDPSAVLDGEKYLYVEAMLDFAKFHMLSFTTSLDFESEDFYNNYTCHNPAHCPDRAHTNKTMKEFYTKQISDVTYETVSNNGSLASVARPVFKLVDSGDIYSPGDVLQAIDSLYYTDEGIKREDVISVFDNLINNAEAALNSADSSVPMSYDISTGYPGVDTSEVSTLRGAIDNLKIILFRSSQKIDLLPKLRLYEKTFPQISTTTATGAFYERYQLALYNTNNAVKKGTQVVKSVNLNRIVIDLISTTDLSLPVELDMFSTEEGSLLYRIKDKNNNYVIANATSTKKPAAYHCFTDPNKIEKYPAGEDLTNLLSEYGFSLPEFYDFDLSAEMMSSAAASNACRDVAAKYAIQIAKRSEGATTAAVTSFRDSRSPSWSTKHEYYVQDLLNALAKSYLNSFRVYGSMPTGVVAFQELIDDLTSIAATHLNYSDSEVIDNYWYPAAVLKHKGDIDTNPYSPYLPDDADRVTVRFGGAGFDGVLAKTDAGSIYDELEGALESLSTDSSETSIKKVVVSIANRFSERAAEAWENYYGADGSGLVTTFSGTTEIPYGQMLYALRKPNSIIVVLYALAVAQRFFNSMEYASSANSVAQITETNAYLGGYWWFDYEKALKQTSMASYAYVIKNVEKYFGPAVFSQTYKVTDASVRRYHQKRNSLRKLSSEFSPTAERVGVIPSDSTLPCCI